MVAKRPTLAQLEERIQRQKKTIRQDEEQVEKLRERIRASQQLLRDMEKDMRAMKYEQIATKMKERNIEVTDDLLDAFIQFAGSHQEGEGDAAPKPHDASQAPAPVPAEASPKEEGNLFPHDPSGTPAGRVPWSNS